MQVTVNCFDDGWICLQRLTLGEVRNFSIILLNVKAAITGLTVQCGLRWEEANVTKFYEQAAVVVVVPQQQSMGLYVEL